MEVDPSGETKVWKDGYPLEGRIFRCRTFQLPGRGETLFMLGADCAHALGYQNPFSLFNQNTSLDEIVVTRTEKESLVEQEIVPGWYTYDMSIRVSVVRERTSGAGRLLGSQSTRARIYCRTCCQRDDARCGES
jgi:hypothetical protein